jgi:23S rRNA G2069 N7-methylase RlmK/C1962 C5-methylase RlmI
MKILDLSAGKRAIWFNKKHPLATYVDKRAEVFPDIVANTTKLPKRIGKNYDLVVFDPPHMNCGKKSNMSRVYGYHTTKQILETIEGTAKEAHRVTRSKALMALKWNDHDIKLQRVFDLMPQWEPLFGQLTKTRPDSKTYWVMLRRKR